MNADSVLRAVMAGELDARVAQEHLNTNMVDPALVAQFFMEGQNYGYSSSLENVYRTSEATAWSVPSDTVNYGLATQEDTKSFSTSTAPESLHISLPHAQSRCHGAGEAVDGLPLVTTGPVLHVNGRQSSCESPTGQMEVCFPSPTASLAHTFPAQRQTHGQAPRLRSLNKRRRIGSKYGSPDACGDGSSDNGIKPRPAHNKAERNYRRRLNSSFEKLLDVMNFVSPKDPTSRHDTEANRELSKGDVLRLARHQLVTLEVENRRLREELRQARCSQRTFSWSELAPTGPGQLAG